MWMSYKTKEHLYCRNCSLKEFFGKIYSTKNAGNCLSSPITAYF